SWPARRSRTTTCWRPTWRSARGSGEGWWEGPMDELTPEQQFATEPTLADIYRALLKGEPPEVIIARLLRYDYSEVGARSHVARAEEDIRRFRASPESRAELCRDALTQMAVGACIALLGLIALAVAVFLLLLGAVRTVWLPIGCVVIPCIGFLYLHRG